MWELGTSDAPTVACLLRQMNFWHSWRRTAMNSRSYSWPVYLAMARGVFSCQAHGSTSQQCNTPCAARDFAARLQLKQHVHLAVAVRHALHRFHQLAVLQRLQALVDLTPQRAGVSMRWHPLLCLCASHSPVAAAGCSALSSPSSKCLRGAGMCQTQPREPV